MALEFVELAALRHPLLLRRLSALRAHIHTPIAPLSGTVATSSEPVPFARRGELRARPVRTGRLWGRAGTCAWFHLTAPLPTERGRPAGQGPRHLALLLDTDGEAIVCDRGGRPATAVTSRLTPIERHGATRGKVRVDLTGPHGHVDALAPEGVVDLWLDAGFNGKLVLPYGVATSPWRCSSSIRQFRLTAN